MSEVACLLCKSVRNTGKYNIDQDYTKYSNLLLRAVLENLFEYNIVLPPNLHVCLNCRDLLNELDLAEISYKNLRQKVLGYFDFKYYGNENSNKSNAYCQTDVFIENVLEYDIWGKTKNADTDVCINEPDTCSKDISGNLNTETKSSLKKHECHVCFKKFISKSGAATHIKRVHNNLNSSCSEDTLKNDVNSDEQIAAPQDMIVTHSETVSFTEELVETNRLNSNNENCEENISDSSSQGENKKQRKSNRGRKKKNPEVLKPYQCTSCPKTWKTLGELKNHLSAHSDVRPFICEICGQAYKHKSALDIHVGMHNGIYPFRCTYCKKSFTQKGALQRHMPIHTGETPYQCDLCGKRFVHHTSFNIHQLSHSGQKDYKCTRCGLGLLSGSHLKRHMRVHTGERNYACSLCDKRFAERYNLASHEKLHEKPTSSAAFKRNHRCQICRITYDRRLKLEEHMARDHQKIIETNVPFIQQLFTKNDTESVWTNTYNIKADVVSETSY